MKIEDIKRLEEKLYKMALTKTMTMLGENKMIPWPISYGFDRAYEELQVYFEGTNKSLHVIKKVGETTECYFTISKKEKVKIK